MSELQDAAVAVSKHHNIITLRSADIQSIQYIEGSFAISDGQPFDLPPEIKGANGVWTIDINCGRHKTAAIADGFNAICGGKDYVYNAYSSSDRTPAELNFYAGFVFKIKVSGEDFEINVYIAQGSNALRNNWWIGSTGIANKGSGPVIIPVAAYEADHESTVTRQIYQIQYKSDNDIELQGWL